MIQRSNSFAYLALSGCAALLSTSIALAQPQMPVPQPSPKASVSQTIGITEITIVYHRPSVRDRKVWGELVPFNEVWRAGANENTTVSFSDPVKVEGKDLPAGTYGLHMIPTADAWTIIFSKNSTSWGSFFYKEGEDALRVTVKPIPANMHEMLNYSFDEVMSTSAVINLRWEKLRVPIKIDVDTKGIVIAAARNAYLRGLAGFSWQGFYQAAAYCLQNDANLDEALTWIDKSVSLNENSTNLYIKAGLLDKLGKSADADAVRERMGKVAASEADVNLLGYQYLGAGKKKEAIEIFKRNVTQHPDSWNVYDSLGEAYATNGDTKLAIENYTKALNMVKDEVNKKRISATLQKLSGK
jgi:tetratricopeptide (TPR) repeat protein